MKTIITPLVSLLVGLGIGCYVGYRECNRNITNEAVRQMLETGESSSALLAATSTQAIRLIDSGEPQKAVELLSRRVARYYSTYATGGSTNEQRLKLRVMIDELARTNRILAAEMAATTNRP
jgi:hypothetical protein